MVPKNLFAGHEQRHRHREETQRGKEQVRRTERATRTYVHHRVWNRQLSGSNCIAQGSQLGALWRPRGVGCAVGREVQEGGDTCILIADSSYCQQQPTQHCKPIILPLNINLKQQQQKAREVLAGRAVLGRGSRFPGRGIWHPSCTIPRIQQKSIDDTWIRTAEPLCCSPETITTLLIGSTTNTKQFLKNDTWKPQTC